MYNPWQGILQFPLGERGKKPRDKGITMVIDKGMGLGELKDLLEVAGDYIDFLKLGFGTSALYHTELLKAKVALCSRHQVRVYPGGTLLEIALLQGNYEPFLERVRVLGMDTVEISDGTITMEAHVRQTCIKRAVQAGLTVITEVGKKNPEEGPEMNQLFLRGQEDLAAGAWKVIMEARESGKGIGIYDKNGQIIEDKLSSFIGGLGDLNTIIWETPLKNQQVEMITRFGAEVNLGNIQPQEVIALETLRTGLRGDTLRLAMNSRGCHAS